MGCLEACILEAQHQYKKLKEADDKAKAKAVDDLISKIGTVTINSGAAINAAWDGYNKLTAEQKELVTKRHPSSPETERSSPRQGSASRRGIQCSRC